MPSPKTLKRQREEYFKAAFELMDRYFQGKRGAITPKLYLQASWLRKQCTSCGEEIVGKHRIGLGPLPLTKQEEKEGVEGEKLCQFHVRCFESHVDTRSAAIMDLFVPATEGTTLDEGAKHLLRTWKIYVAHCGSETTSATSCHGARKNRSWRFSQEDSELEPVTAPAKGGSARNKSLTNAAVQDDVSSDESLEEMIQPPYGRTRVANTNSTVRNAGTPSTSRSTLAGRGSMSASNSSTYLTQSAWTSMSLDERHDPVSGSDIGSTRRASSSIRLDKIPPLSTLVKEQTTPVPTRTGQTNRSYQASPSHSLNPSKRSHTSSLLDKTGQTRTEAGADSERLGNARKLARGHRRLQDKGNSIKATTGNEERAWMIENYLVHKGKQPGTVVVRPLSSALDAWQRDLTRWHDELIDLSAWNTRSRDGVLASQKKRLVQFYLGRHVEEDVDDE